MMKESHVLEPHDESLLQKMLDSALCVAIVFQEKRRFAVLQQQLDAAKAPVLSRAFRVQPCASGKQTHAIMCDLLTTGGMQMA